MQADRRGARVLRLDRVASHSRLDLSKVRLSRRRSRPEGRVSKARTPSPTMPAPIIRCSSSTKPAASRSFQSRWLPKTKMSRPEPRLSRSTFACASHIAQRGWGPSPRLRRAASGLSDLLDGGVEPRDFAFDGWLGGVVGNRRPVRPKALVRRTAKKKGIGRPQPLHVVGRESAVERHSHDIPVWAGEEAVERNDVGDNELSHGRPRGEAGRTCPTYTTRESVGRVFPTRIPLGADGSGKPEPFQRCWIAE